MDDTTCSESGTMRAISLKGTVTTGVCPGIEEGNCYYYCNPKPDIQIGQ